MMHLYGSKRAPNSDRVEMFLAEKGIEVPFIEVNLMKGEHYGEDYRKLAPNRRVPCLVLDDGTTVRESIAICRYFEELHPEPPLFGVGPLERARVEMWQRLMEFELFLPIGMRFRHGHPAMAALEKPQFPDFGEAQAVVALKRIGVLNKELADRRYLLGDTFTVADITAYIALGFGKLSKIVPDPEQHPNVIRYLADIAVRPGAQAIRGKA
jgi:glutathione S-transferase